ncbi:MAG: hypothetical protein ACFB0D_20225, partial [Phormidesmis sp.]
MVVTGRTYPKTFLRTRPFSGTTESTNPSNGVGVLFEDGSRFTGTLTNSGTINGGRDGVNFGNGGTARGS